MRIKKEMRTLERKKKKNPNKNKRKSRRGFGAAARENVGAGKGTLTRTKRKCSSSSHPSRSGKEAKEGCGRWQGRDRQTDRAEMRADPLLVPKGLAERWSEEIKAQRKGDGIFSLLN